MGNINNFNFNKLDVRLSNSDFWDFYLATDASLVPISTGLMSGSCFVVWYDFNNPSIYPNNSSSATSIYSLVSWDGAINTGYTLSTIGLTGIDNGLITFDKTSGDTSNQALLSALTGSTLIIPSGDTRMVMNQVTGTTGVYSYPITPVIDLTNTGDYVNLCGGFYQGYYKIDGSTYEVLPTRVNQAWSAEFWLRPQQDNCSGFTGTTLNDTYPNNKGLFFYMGTRAENKFWNQFSGVDSGCTSGCTQPSGCTDTLSPWCTTVREKDITIIGDYGFAIPLNPPQIEIELVTNQFLIYGRAIDNRAAKLTGQTDTMLLSGITNTSSGPNGYGNYFYSDDGLGAQTVRTYDGNGIAVARTKEVLSNDQNPFLIYGRSTSSLYTGCTCGCCGTNDGLGNQTVCSFSGRTSPQASIDYNIDIHDNALGFRIKDDGSIGYRLLTLTGSCYTADTGEILYTSGVTIQEEYSEPNTVSANTWSYIAIRFVTNYYDDCQLETDKPRVGKLMFYVNGYLKFVVPEFPEFVAKRLNEYRAKQVGVPFNFSLGGGTQGLIESQTFDGPDMNDRNLPIETNFAGSFIGSISQFKFNICDLPFTDIQYNYSVDAARYNLPYSIQLILDEDGDILLQEDGHGLILN